MRMNIRKKNQWIGDQVVYWFGLCGLLQEVTQTTHSQTYIVSYRGRTIVSLFRYCFFTTMYNPQSDVYCHLPGQSYYHHLFITTRPKPAYGRQGVDWIVGPGYSLWCSEPTNLWKPTKNHENPWNHLEKPKMSRHRRGVPTDLLWSKKRYVTETGSQLTF